MGGAPAWTIVQVIVALVLDLSGYWRVRAALSLYLSQTLPSEALALPGPSLSLRPRRRH